MKKKTKHKSKAKSKKITFKKVTFKATLPRIVEVRDYHDFKANIDVIEDFLGIENLDVKEMGCDGDYFGILYVKGTQKSPAFRELERQLSNREDRANCVGYDGAPYEDNLD